MHAVQKMRTIIAEYRRRAQVTLVGPAAVFPGLGHGDLGRAQTSLQIQSDVSVARAECSDP